MTFTLLLRHRPIPSPRAVRGFGATVFAEFTALALPHGAVNLGQGFPNFAAPDFVKAAAQAAIGADLNQYARSAGHPRAGAGAGAGLYSPRFGRTPRPDDGDRRHRRRHRRHLCHHAGARRSRRRGAPDRTLLRQLPGRRDHGGRRARLCAAACAGGQPQRRRMDARHGRAGRRLHAAHQAADPQHAAQPAGQGLQPRRTARAGRACLPLQPDRAQRRSLRVDGLPARRACAHRHAARHVGAHHHPGQRRQDLLRHRLEDRLGDCAAARWRTPSSWRTSGFPLP